MIYEIDPKDDGGSVMEKKSKHSKLFYQYLLSYVLILATPLIILSVFIGGCVLDILKQEIHENNMYLSFRKL